MDGREIPGFYYDKEKKKYFKILPNHAAPPGNRYSKENIVKEKQAEKAQREASSYRETVRKQLLQRSKILVSPTAAGTTLARETSTTIDLDKHRDNAARTYAAGLREVWRARVGNHIRVFAADPSTDSFLIGHGEHEWQEFGATYISADRNKCRTAYREIAVVRQNDITSVSLSPSRVAMTTTMGSGEPAYIIISPLADRAFGLPPISRLQITYRRQDETDVWCSAANPFLHDVSTFAAGLSDKVVLYSDAEGYWNDYKLLETGTDAVAVEWLTQSVLATGLRSGLVHLSDTRSGGSSLRLQHPGSITGIRRVSGESLVVCGMSDALAMYDLRMPLVAKIGRAPVPLIKRRRHVDVDSNKIFSQPVVQYKFKSAMFRAGFDVSTDANVVAAVDSDNLVQLYSLHSGCRVKTLAVNRPSTLPEDLSKPRNLVSHLQFTSTGAVDSFTREQLVACCGSELVVYQW